MDNLETANLDAVTVEDLEALSYFKHIYILVNDGRISGFVEEQ